MALFTILSADRSYRSAQISAPDARGVLHIVNQLDIDEADVLEDDQYRFSVQQLSSGAWCIFQRDHTKTAKVSAKSAGTHRPALA